MGVVVSHAEMGCVLLISSGSCCGLSGEFMYKHNS